MRASPPIAVKPGVGGDTYVFHDILPARSATRLHSLLEEESKLRSRVSIIYLPESRATDAGCIILAYI